MTKPSQPWLVGVVLALCGVLALSGCATGVNAPSTGGGDFKFVSPGGQTVIRYDPPGDRGTIGNLSGESLMEAGSTIGLEDFAGEVVVVNIWGSWCGPCRVEAPALEQVQEDTRDLGVQLLGINVRDNRAAAQDFTSSYGLTYPSIYDPKMRALIALGSFPTTVIPATLVLDREHRVAAVFLKAVTAEELQPVVEQIAAEK